MADQHAPLQRIDFGELFPWTHVFRAFRIALDFRKLLLAAAALVLIAGGHWFCSTLPFAPQSLEFEHQRDWPYQQQTGFGSALSVLRDFVGGRAEGLTRVAGVWQLAFSPLKTFVEPAKSLLDARSSVEQVALAWTQLLWTLIVWALFGGAITRMAAVQFARGEQISLRAALRFSGRYFLSYVGAPLLPIAGVVLMWALCLAGGLVGRIPIAGEVIVAALWVIPLAMGFVMALILVGIGAGWPLMFATISTEGSDAFDGFSRAYNYVFGRPWQFLWLAALVMLYGSVLIFFVSLMASLVVYLAGWAVAAGMGRESVAALYQVAPHLVGGPNMMGETQVVSTSAGGPLAGFWLNMMALLVAGFVYSYFWTAATIVYSVLRKSDELTEFDEVYLPDEEEEDDLLPLVGVAASNQPVVERSPFPPQADE